MAVRAYSPVLPSVELFGAYEGIVSATGVNQKVSLTFTPTTGNLTIVPYDGDANISQLQLEVGSTPSSYIPTLVSSTVTRAADTMTIPAVNMPWPEPVVIGPEVVTNGTFDDGLTGWTSGGFDSSILEGGGARIERDAVTNSALVQTGVFETGKLYEISYDVISGSGNTGASILLVGKNIDSVVGSYSVVYYASTTVFEARCYSGNFAVLDNISVREINPLAVSIQMEGTMTYADLDTSTGNPIFATWQADANNNIILKNNTYGASITGRVDFIQEAGGVVDVVTSGNTAYTPGINVPFNIASRHGSTFLNGAVDGVALTANTTPTALPDLSATDMQIGSTFMGTIKLFRVWADDLTDAGIAEASA
jgi:hypothetical protein